MATSTPVVESSNTLSWAHQLACVEDPTQCLFAKQVLAGAKQILAHRTQKKEPNTPVIFEQFVSKSPGKEAPLSDIHIVTVCLIGFAGFLRLNEIDNLKESDVQVFDEHMELFIGSSKTDQYCDGPWVTTARSSSTTCPVQMVER